MGILKALIKGVGHMAHRRKHAVVNLQSQVHTSVLGLGVDFVLPLSQQELEQEPPPKSIRRGCIRRLTLKTQDLYNLSKKA